MTHQRTRWAMTFIAVITLASTLVACGSTRTFQSADGSAGSVASGGDGLALDVGQGQTTDAPLEPDPVGAGSTGTSAVGGSAPDSPGYGSAAPPSDGTSPSGSPSSLPVTGHGYDAKNVYIGFPTNNDASQAAGSLGLSGLDFADQIAQAKAVVADLNKRGGLFGRTVVPLIHDLATASLQADASAQAQQTCAYFTQDNKVVAIVNIVAAIDLEVFYDCLAKSKTPLLTAGFVGKDGIQLKRYEPYLYTLSAADYDAFGSVWIDRLLARGYFGGWDAATSTASTLPTKVGLLHADAQPSKRIFVKLANELKKRKIQVTTDVGYDVSSLQAEASAMSSAVLRMRSDGVTHVLGDGADIQLFMAAADSQNYRPRYGLNSYLAPQLQAGNTPRQLVGSMGLGWIPAADVAANKFPTAGVGEKACRKLMAERGIALSSYGVELIAFSMCDGVHLVEQGVKVAQNFGPGSLRQALSSIGSRFSSALDISGAISSTSTALPKGGLDFSWATSCSCFSYLDRVTHRW